MTKAPRWNREQEACHPSAAFEAQTDGGRGPGTAALPDFRKAVAESPQEASPLDVGRCEVIPGGRRIQRPQRCRRPDPRQIQVALIQRDGTTIAAARLDIGVLDAAHQEREGGL